jgi:glycerol uptake facilitator-like aquaporin
VLVYADDITVFLSNVEDIEKVHHAIRIYEQATGAHLNPNKSRALAVGGCTEPITPLGIVLFQQVKILGVTFGSTVDATVQDSWTKVTNAVRAQARTAYARNFCLAHQVQYVQT